MAVAEQQRQESGWVGWVMFAAVMMALSASFHLINGLVSLFKEEYYLVGSSGLVVSVDYTAWGWVELALAALLGFAAVSLFTGRMYGRVVGVIAAVLSAVVNLAFLAAYPVWSVVIIAVDVIVIYAIVVHGRELEA